MTNVNTPHAVTLLYPPFCKTSIYMPHLGLPTLAGYLGKCGISCKTFDLNVRLHHWLRAPGGLYERKIRERVARFMALQRGGGDETPESIHRLFLDLAGAPTHLLEQELGDRIVGHADKDSYNTKEALPTFGLQDNLEGQLWGESTNSFIANTVTQAINMHGSLMSGPFGDFIGTAQTEDVLNRASKSPLIGISISFSVQLAAALAIARNLKERSPNAMIVLGGSQISLLDARDLERLVRLPFITAVGRYEGEKALEHLHHAAQGEISLKDVPNIVYQDEAGVVHTNDTVRSVALNDLPQPVFSEEDMPLFAKGTLPVGVTRGCYWGKCTFCDYVKLMAPGQSRYIGRDVKLVVDEIVANQAKYSANHFWLITEALPPAWAAHFAKEILARGVRATFWSYLKNEKKEIWTQDLLNLMASAGIVAVTCGVESTTDRVLKVIDKGTTREVIKDNFERFASAGISAGFNLIPDYPTTTLAEAADGIQFVLDNRDIITNINAQMFDLSVQSAVAGSPEQFGIEITEEIANDTTHGAHSLNFKRKLGLQDDERGLVARAYSDLQEELSRYHLTRPSRRVMDARDFLWEKSRFVMDQSCRAIRSNVNLSGEPSEVVVIVRGAFGSEGVEVPAEYARVVGVLTGRNRGFITFAELVAAYTADVLEAAGVPGQEQHLDDAQRTEIVDACVDLLQGIAEGGTGRIYANVDTIRATTSMAELLERGRNAPPAPVLPARDDGAPRTRLPVLAL